MNLHDYKVKVVRNEIFQVSDNTLELERLFQRGKADRIANKPCLSNNGAYLNGWYSSETKYYYIDKEAAFLL